MRGVKNSFPRPCSRPRPCFPGAIQLPRQLADHVFVVTFSDLEAMNPLRGTATTYDETLQPRPGEHLVVIDAAGHLDDGRPFEFHVTHVEDEFGSAVRFRTTKRSRAASNSGSDRMTESKRLPSGV